MITYVKGIPKFRNYVPNSLGLLSGVSVQLQPSNRSRKISGFNSSIFANSTPVFPTKTPLFFWQNAEGLTCCKKNFVRGFGCVYFGRNGKTLEHAISDQRDQCISSMVEMQLLLETGGPRPEGFLTVHV